MTSVERVVEYTELESEAPWETKKRPLPDWPNKGLVTFDLVSFSYSPEGAPVLKDISFTFKPNEKVGIVGRTGAGKSSLVSALFRLAEPQGKIYIDGVLTSEIGLHDLRTKMSIIPQDPVLFTGSMRKNLDPFCQHSDEDLWRALEEVQLKSVVEELPRKLETVLAESGSNFSVGQRQLVCLARAVLRQNRILVIDEATANVDPGTDELIQKTIRDKFRECTVLTIAHRLNTIIDSDRIMVLDSGTIQELDRPFNLLQNKDGALYKMVQQMGRAEAAALLKAATVPLLQLGQKRRLEENDMYRVLPEDQSKVLGEELHRCWDHEVRKATKELRKPNLTGVLIKCYGMSYAMAGSFTFSLEAIKVIQPLLLGEVIVFFENYDEQTSLRMVYVYAAAMSISPFALTILQHLYYYYVQRIGMRIRVAMCHMIYKKALGLSSESMGQTTTGRIVNLLSNDVNRFDEITLNLHYLWLGPLQAMTVFGKLFGIFRSKTAVLADNRIHIMNEVVSGIRIIKMYAWEKPFSALVTDVRRKEIRQILKSSYLRGLNMASSFASSKIIVFITFTVYVLLGNTIDASTVFVTVSLYGTIKLTKLSETAVSVRRIEEFLLLEEIERKSCGLSLEEKKDNSVEITKMTCYWDK
ncbi:hypothetical protein KUCAC02_001163, partial [Chaenocephalus aceratus]